MALPLKWKYFLRKIQVLFHLKDVALRRDRH
ncbi:MAG: hypothetical protein RIS64_3458 [Bacteroidota bacterium]|jgi:hypothetical protein